MFWGLLIFRGHSTREPASIVRNDEQGYLIVFCGLTQGPALATAKTGITRKRVWKMKVNGPGRLKTSEEKTLAVGKACRAIF